MRNLDIHLEYFYPYSASNNPAGIDPKIPVELWTKMPAVFRNYDTHEDANG